MVAPAASAASLLLAALLAPCRALHATGFRTNPFDEFEWSKRCPVKGTAAMLVAASPTETEGMPFIAEGMFQVLLKHASGIRRQGVGGGRLIHRTRRDQSGAFILNMLNAKQVARLYGLEYLGTFPATTMRSAETAPLLRTLGLPMPLEALPDGTITVQTIQEFFSEVERDPSATFFVDCDQMHHADRHIRDFSLHDSEFLTELGRDAQFPPAELWSERAKLRVAVHVRRGDVMAKMMSSRLLPNSYYLAVMDRLAALAPGAEFVVFGQAPFSCRKEGYLLEDFARRADVVLRIGHSLGEAWAHMAKADVFVMSPSAFSAVPALYSHGVIIDPVRHGAHDRVLATDGTAEMVAGASWRQALADRLASSRREQTAAAASTVST